MRIDGHNEPTKGFDEHNELTKNKNQLPMVVSQFNIFCFLMKFFPQIENCSLEYQNIQFLNSKNLNSRFSNVHFENIQMLQCLFAEIFSLASLAVQGKGGGEVVARQQQSRPLATLVCLRNTLIQIATYMHIYIMET